MTIENRRENGRGIDKPKKYSRRYPWRTWFAAREFRLTRGEDYDCLTHGMAGMIRNVARKLRIKVSLTVSENTIDVVVGG